MNGLVDSATNENLKETEAKNRPSDSKFKQQKLPAWQPILTAGTVLPTFFVIGLIFIPCGVGFLVSSNMVFEELIDYSDCVMVGTSKPCKEFEGNVTAGEKIKCECVEKFTIKEDIKRSVYLYYSLTNYYQNHRRYVKSRDDKQLLGNIETLLKISQDCDPFRSVGVKEGTVEKPYGIVPCGAIANSLFNDTFKISKVNRLGPNGDPTPNSDLPLTETGIAWETDKDTKFGNPDRAKSCGAFNPDETIISANQTCWQNAFLANETRPPPFWQKEVWKLDPEHPNNNGFLNEHFIVWMRTAALPNFRKLYAKLDNQSADGVYMKKGDYELIIDYNYPVQSFSGRKRVILSTTSWLGGKNPFLGVAYIVVGSLCVLLGVVFLVIHIKFGKSLAEMSNISGAN